MSVAGRARAVVGRVVAACVVAAGLAASGSVLADGGAVADDIAAGEALLDAYLADLDTVHAHFVQILYDGDGRLLSESSGEMRLRRPGRFRWEYAAPYPQLMVADGEDLWIYDPDLEQVTVRSLKQSLKDTPASLLVSGEDFREQFRVTHTEQSKGGQAVRLEPRAEGADFRYVALRFRDGDLERIEAVDRLDQLTRIDFDEVKRGGRIRRGLFRFSPPPDADVIDQRNDGA